MTADTPWRTEFRRAAEEFLRHCHPDLKRPLREEIDKLPSNPEAGKALGGELLGFRRLAVRRFRVIYRILRESHRIEIILIGPRDTIYGIAERFVSGVRERGSRIYPVRKRRARIPSNR